VVLFTGAYAAGAHLGPVTLGSHLTVEQQPPAKGTRTAAASGGSMNMGGGGSMNMGGP
jgi:hypothetical protein